MNLEQVSASVYSSECSFGESRTGTVGASVYSSECSLGVWLGLWAGFSGCGVSGFGFLATVPGSSRVKGWAFG